MESISGGRENLQLELPPKNMLREWADHDPQVLRTLKLTKITRLRTQAFKFEISNGDFVQTCEHFSN